MIKLLQYQFKSNSRSLLTVLLVFVVIQLLIFLNMKVFHMLGAEQETREVMSFVGAFLTFFAVMLFLLFQTFAMFRQLIKNPLTRMIPVRGWTYLVSALLYWTITAAVVQIIGLGAMHILLYASAGETEIHTGLRQLLTANPSQQGLFSIIGYAESYAMLVQLFFAIVLAYSLPIAAKAKGIVCAIFFFVVNAVLNFIRSLVEGAFPNWALLEDVNKIGYGDGAGQLTVSIFPSTLHLYGVIFNIVCLILLIAGTAFLIEKQVEN